RSPSTGTCAAPREQPNLPAREGRSPLRRPFLGETSPPMVSRRQMLGATAAVAGTAALVRASRAQASQADPRGAGWDATYSGVGAPAFPPAEPNVDYVPCITPGGATLPFRVVDGV